MADLVDQFCATGRQHFSDQCVSGRAIFSSDADLDQFVMIERDLDFLEHARRQSTFGDHDNGVQVVGQTTQEAFLGIFESHDLCSGDCGGAKAIMKQFVTGFTNPMGRSKSSSRWLNEHFSDPFVKKAQVEGMRSRAAYKLEELLERDGVLRPGMVVVDLGSAPGGWSQVAQNWLNGRGRVVALDILAMDPVPGVEFIQGDFTQDSVLAELEQLLGETKVDLVLSDMAPNMSGVASVDQARAMLLAEIALDFASAHLRRGGAYLIKLFQGAEFDQYVKLLRTRFDKVTLRKPKASRDRSREVYALATGFKDTIVQ